MTGGAAVEISLLAKAAQGLRASWAVLLGLRQRHATEGKWCVFREPRGHCPPVCLQLSSPGSREKFLGSH